MLTQDGGDVSEHAAEVAKTFDSRSAEFAEAVEASTKTASEALTAGEVPPELRKTVQSYFGALKKKADQTKPADKPAQRSSAPAAARTADSEPGLAKKNAASAVPHVEADSSPTLKRVPDENLIKASRDRSRPHSDAIARKAAPSSDSDVMLMPSKKLTSPTKVREFWSKSALLFAGLSR